MAGQSPGGLQERGLCELRELPRGAMHSSLGTTDVTSPGGHYEPVAKDAQISGRRGWSGFPRGWEHGRSTDGKEGDGEPTSGLVSLGIRGSVRGGPDGSWGRGSETQEAVLGCIPAISEERFWCFGTYSFLYDTISSPVSHTRETCLWDLVGHVP